MANLAGTDFSNYELYELSQEPHWVHEIADGVITEMAHVFGVELSTSPNSDELGLLVGAIGKSKVLRENIGQVQEVLGTDASALEITSDWVERSGVQKPLDRSLWTSNIESPMDAYFVLTGGVANWQDRAADILVSRARVFGSGTVFYPVGDRIMSSDSEVVNPRVMAFEEANGVLPSEAQYAQHFIAPWLEGLGYDVLVTPLSTKGGSEIASEFVRLRTNTGNKLQDRYTFVRVANAGIQLAVQFRRAMRAKASSFDDLDNPQAYMLTDTFPIARTEEEANDAVNFQNPKTAIRQVALTAKMLQEVIESI